jgi:hypothetical protein
MTSRFPASQKNGIKGSPAGGGYKPLEIQFDEAPSVSVSQVSPICSAIGQGFFRKNSK